MPKNKQVKVSVWQRVCLIILGLFLSLVILEIGLRAGGFVLLSLQEYKNRLSLKQKGVYRIMCIGESTTQGQYPGFLEEILNQHNTGIKFSVIDKGIVDTNTVVLLSQLEGNLDTYKPDMVVAMMGNNDLGLYFSSAEAVNVPEKPLFSRPLKVCKLANLLWLYIAAKAKEIKFHSQEKEDYVKNEGFISQEGPLKKAIKFNLKDAAVYEALGEEYKGEKKFPEAEQAFKKSLKFDPQNCFVHAKLGDTYRIQQKFPEAEQAFKQALNFNSNCELAYVLLGRMYGDLGRISEAEQAFKKTLQLNSKNIWAYSGLGRIYSNYGRFTEAEQVFKKALELDLQNDSLYMDLGRIYKRQKKFPEAEDAFKKALECNPKNDFAYTELGFIYLCQRKFVEVERFFKKSLELNPNNVRGYAGLESIYFERDNLELFKEYMEKTRQLRQKEFKPRTINNYLKLKQILDKRNIRLVCVQYPMLSIKPLKKIFEGQKGAIFVDNEETFKDAVKSNGYKAYFRDMFEGDFGHCTEKGNKLLARNIADAILKEVFKE
ncbi:MAG: tetratricopeptide repeat protein [Candidatus Omnitrophota bacterium]|nr:tetratricopeptide repeat protein [Candidatus Omnitrophota bacterium]